MPHSIFTSFVSLCVLISIRILALLIIFLTCSGRSIRLRSYSALLPYSFDLVSSSVVRWIHALILSSMVRSLKCVLHFLSIVVFLFLYFINSFEFDSLSMCKCFFLFIGLKRGAFVYALYLTRLLSMNLNIVGSHRKQCQCAFATGRIWLMNVVVICVNSNVARILFCVCKCFFWVKDAWNTAPICRWSIKNWKTCRVTCYLTGTQNLPYFLHIPKYILHIFFLFSLGCCIPKNKTNRSQIKWTPINA